MSSWRQPTDTKQNNYEKNAPPGCGLCRRFDVQFRLRVLQKGRLLRQACGLHRRVLQRPRDVCQVLQGRSRLRQVLP